MRTRREFEFQLAAVCLMVHKFLHFNFLVDYIKHFANHVDYKKLHLYTRSTAIVRQVWISSY